MLLTPTPARRGGAREDEMTAIATYRLTWPSWRGHSYQHLSTGERSATTSLFLTLCGAGAHKLDDARMPDQAWRPCPICFDRAAKS